jgi:hypothetical protein
MNQTEQSQSARVSDTTFAREMWRYSERGNVEGAKNVREMWKNSKMSEGYATPAGPLSIHEINAFAEKAGDDMVGFARSIERAALIKAYTLLPELRQAAEAKHHRRYFGNGVNWGLITYSGAILALALGQAPNDTEEEVPAKPVKPRRGSEIAKLERESAADVLRPKFEAWAGQRQFDLRRQEDGYTNMVTAYCWMGWLAAGQAQDETKGAGAAQTCRSSEKVQVVHEQNGDPLAPRSTQSEASDALQLDESEPTGALVSNGRAFSQAMRKVAEANENHRVLSEVLETMLWLYRRLPHCYGRPPTVEQPILALAEATRTDVADCLAERGPHPLASSGNN